MCARLSSRCWNTAGNKTKILACTELKPRERRPKKQNNLIKWIVCMMLITAMMRDCREKERSEWVWRGYNLSRWSWKPYWQGACVSQRGHRWRPGTNWWKKQDEKKVWGGNMQRGAAWREGWDGELRWKVGRATHGRPCKPLEGLPCFQGVIWPAFHSNWAILWTRWRQTGKNKGRNREPSKRLL